MKEIASICVVVMVAMSLFVSLFYDNIGRRNTDERWEKIEEAGSYTYYRDRKHPEVCTLHNVSFVLLGVAESLAYVPCDLILEDHDKE